jgi:hypothetical protein
VLFSTLLLLMFFSTILLPPLAFVCAQSSMLPFPLLFIVVFQMHSLQSYYVLSLCCELKNFENTHNFQQQMQIVFYGYLIFSYPWTSRPSNSVFICPPFFNQCMILEINITHHYKFMCPLYNQVEALSIIIMNERCKCHFLNTPHL